MSADGGGAAEQAREALERLIAGSKELLALLDGRKPRPAAAREALARLGELATRAAGLAQCAVDAAPDERRRLGALADEAQRLNALARARTGELARAASFGIDRARAARAIVAARKTARSETGRSCDVRA